VGRSGSAFRWPQENDGRKMASYLPQTLRANAKIMVFVDGENLAIRYQERLNGRKQPEHVSFEPNVYVWSEYLNMTRLTCDVIRKHYYTCVQGDTLKIEDVEARLKNLGIEAPRVFKKTKGKQAKRVDISLATDMLSHAHRKNYSVAVLVAGDEDYVPLVEAVMGEGCRVVLWFLKRGLSPALQRKADYFFDMEEILLNDDTQLLNMLY
jgi:uncharacterized LabA/DUF88 family protein